MSCNSSGICAFGNSWGGIAVIIFFFINGNGKKITY